MKTAIFELLTEFISQVPALQPGIGQGQYDDGNWWIKFSIDISHELAWNVVQEFGHILNYLSLSERLPAAFYPVSPPPYLNGGPDEYLSWIIESKDPDFTPGQLRVWLEGRLPKPVNDLKGWV